MQPHAVVEALDVVGDVRLSLGMFGVITLLNPLGLETQEEALHHRVVQAVAFVAHAAD